MINPCFYVRRESNRGVISLNVRFLFMFPVVSTRLNRLDNYNSNLQLPTDAKLSEELYIF